MGHKYHYSWKYFLDWTHMLFQKSKQRSEYFYEAKTNKSIFEHSFPPIVLQKMLKESVWQFLPHSFLPTLICFTISLASHVVQNYNNQALSFIEFVFVCMHDYEQKYMCI